MADPFAKMHERLFAHFGQAALLRGSPVTVVIDRGVEMLGEYAQVIGYATTAEFAAGTNPAAESALELIETGESFVLDKLIRDNGRVSQWMLRAS